MRQVRLHLNVAGTNHTHAGGRATAPRTAVIEATVASVVPEDYVETIHHGNGTIESRRLNPSQRR